jgi:molecular chaperone DnaK
VLVLGGGVAFALALNKNGASTNNTLPNPTTVPTSAAAPTPTVPAVPAFAQCTDAIKGNTRWVCVTKASISGNELRVEYTFGNNGTKFNINGGFHVHFYGANADATDPADTQEGAPNGGKWYIEDQQPSVHAASSNQYQTIEGHPVICARIANGSHHLVADNTGNGTFKTGNCFTLTTTS